MRRLVVLVALAMLIVPALGLPHFVAGSRADASLSVQEGAAALDAAKDILFDNPIEQIRYLALAVTKVEFAPQVPCLESFGRARDDGRAYIVEAYTFFGIPATRVRVTCDGNSSRL